MKLVRIFTVPLLAAGLVLGSCSQYIKDENIKKILVAGAREETAFAGVNVIVSDAVVTLSGTCSSEKQKSKVEERARHISGVKEVINNIQVGSVTLNGDFPLKQAADSVLMKYALVQANVQDSVITLQGKAKKEELKQLQDAIAQLQPKGLTMLVSAE